MRRWAQVKWSLFERREFVLVMIKMADQCGDFPTPSSWFSSLESKPSTIDGRQPIQKRLNLLRPNYRVN